MNITEIMRAIKFPQSDIDCILGIEDRCEAKLKAVMNEFYNGEIEYKPAIEKINEMDWGDINIYTVHMLFLLYCAEVLYKKYKEKNLPEQLFIDTVMDLKYKLDECRNVHGVCGTSVGKWFGGFFEMIRFAHGRLQYDYRAFTEEDYTLNGITVKTGDMTLTCHIPSSGPLTKELVYDSLKKAYEFNKDLPIVKKYGILPVTCYSWLLYPDYRNVFGEKSNTRAFMDMFNIIKTEYDEEFGNAWRVFGNAYGKVPVDELPQNTSLQKSFVAWLKAGNKNGSGVGILLFDGEKIISHN